MATNEYTNAMSTRYFFQTTCELLMITDEFFSLGFFGFVTQSGLSRELFEQWCTDRRNGVIIAGYCVEGTLAKVG